KKASAERIVSIFESVEPSVGRVQEDRLYNAIVAAYDSVANTDMPWPDFHMVKDHLDATTPKPDSLTSIFRPLTEHKFFARRDADLWESLVARTAIIDIHELPACKELVVFLVLNEIYRQLKSLGSTREDENTKTREMR